MKYTPIFMRLCVIKNFMLTLYFVKIKTKMQPEQKYNAQNFFMVNLTLIFYVREVRRYYPRRDHLGNNREVVKFPSFGGAGVVGELVQVTNYYPSGLPWTTTEEQNADLQPYKFNGCEFIEMGGLDITDLGNRGIYHAISRFTTIDRFCEKVPWQSPYVFANNNPIYFVDLKGDSAWNITNEWNDEYIADYQQSVSNQIQQYIDNGEKFTCEDLALSVLIDFASANGLPVTITNGTGTLDARSDNYTDVGTFRRDVLNTTGARDLQNSNNTSSINISISKAGDMILNRHDNGDAHHVQVITDTHTYGSPNIQSVDIAQGNMNRPVSSQVNSWLYAGVNVQIGFYSIWKDTYYNVSKNRTVNNYSTTENIETRRWNFTNF